MAQGHIQPGRDLHVTDVIHTYLFQNKLKDNGEKEADVKDDVGNSKSTFPL